MRGLDTVLDELRPALRANIASLAEDLLGKPNVGLSSRVELRWGNKGSLRITVNGHARGACADFESDWKGDPLGLIQRERGCGFIDAVLWGAAWAGIDTEGRQAGPEDHGAKRARVVAREQRRIQDEAAAGADRKRRIGVAQRLWQRRTDPIDTVAERYVVLTRHIPIKPGLWPDAVAFLPSNGPLVWHEAGPDGAQVTRSADCAGALILAATLPDGTVSAVQRVFLTDDADNVRRTDGSKIKITNGDIKDTGAAVRLPGPADGPVLIAEGPETGLALWASTGNETHIAVGALSRMRPPPGRRLVVCRDDDKPASPADKALARLIIEWRKQGVNLTIATPWRSRRGDRSDFNDTIKAGGAAAVRERIAIALNPSASPPKRMPVAKARRVLDESVERFFVAATEWEACVARAGSEAKTRADTLIWARLPDEARARTLARADAKAAGMIARAARREASKTPPGEARTAARAKSRLAEAAAKQARQRAADAAGEARPLRQAIDQIKRRARKTVAEATRALIAAAPVHAIRVDTGIGKSQMARRSVALHLQRMRAAGDIRAVAFAVPTHALGAEQVALFNALPEAAGLAAAVWRGREAADLDAPGQNMCRDLPAVEDGRSALADIQTAICRRTVNGKVVECPHFAVCGYQRQRSARADLWFIPHELLFSAKPAAIDEPALVVIDESVWQAGLIDVRDIALDALAQDNTVAGDGLAGERLNFLRHRLLDALHNLPDGPIPWSAMDGSDITPTTAGEAEALEWRRMVEPAIYPNMPPAARKEAANAAAGNRTIPRLVRLWQALKMLTRPNGPAASGWAALATVETREGPVRVIRLKGRRDIGKGWAGLPTLLLDATLDPTLLRPIWPAVELTADVRAEAPHQRIRQVVDRTYSKAYCNNARALRNVHAIISREARHYAPGRVLVVAQQAIEDALPKLGPLPVNVELAHHNAVAGRDEWGAGPDRAGVAALIVVGRAAASPAAVEDMAEALTGAVIERLPGWYAKTDTVRELASGIMEAAEADRHPHPVAEAVRWQIAEGELVQIIGRARGVNRTAADPVEVLVMVNAPLPLPVNETIAAADLMSRPVDLMLAAGGVALANPADASRSYPDLWRTRNAAKLAFERAGQMWTKNERLASFPNKELLITKRPQPREICPHLEFIEYQVAGAGHGRSEAQYDPALVPDIAAWLTERLGPLAWCGSPPERAANVVETMAAAGLIPNSPGHAAAIYPGLFASRDAATKAIGRILAGRHVLDLECAARLTCRVRYQVAGARLSPAEALAAPDRLATLRTDIEAALGPLAKFEIRPPAPRLIAAMTDTDKLAIRAALQGGRHPPDGTPPEVPGGYGEGLSPAGVWAPSASVMPDCLAVRR